MSLCRDPVDGDEYAVEAHPQLLEPALNRGRRVAVSSRLSRSSLLAPVLHQLELAVDVAESAAFRIRRRAAGVSVRWKLLPQGGAGVLGGEQLAQLVEGDAEQVAQAQDLPAPGRHRPCV